MSTQTIGSSLGDSALHAGVYAGAVGFIILAIFLILWYRLPGIIAVVALVVYIVIMLALFKFIPVVLTAAGIAGFILSVGLAVDANILIAERMKEELRAGSKFMKQFQKDLVVRGSRFVIQTLLTLSLVLFSSGSVRPLSRDLHWYSVLE